MDVLAKKEAELKASKPNEFFLLGYMDQKAGVWQAPVDGPSKDLYTKGHDLRLKQVIQERRKSR